MTWQRGRQIVTSRREAMEGSLREFVDELGGTEGAPAIVPGTAIFLNRGTTTPLALRANVERNRVRHEQVVILTIEIDTIPRVRAADRIQVDALDNLEDGITQVILRFGYAETADVLAALARLTPEQTEGQIDLAGRRTSSRGSSCVPAVNRRWPGGASICSSLPRTSLPMPPITSICRATR